MYEQYDEEADRYSHPPDLQAADREMTLLNNLGYKVTKALNAVDAEATTARAKAKRTEIIAFARAQGSVAARKNDAEVAALEDDWQATLLEAQVRACKAQLKEIESRRESLEKIASHIRSEMEGLNHGFTGGGS
jgi:chromosome segregation ATPase